MILARNTKDMNFRRWMVTMPSVSCLSILKNTRAKWVKPVLAAFKFRESVKNARFHTRKIIPLIKS